MNAILDYLAASAAEVDFEELAAATGAREPLRRLTGRGLASVREVTSSPSAPSSRSPARPCLPPRLGGHLDTERGAETCATKMRSVAAELYP